jgi:hypothetical protein
MTAETLISGLSRRVAGGQASHRSLPVQNHDRQKVVLDKSDARLMIRESDKLTAGNREMVRLTREQMERLQSADRR